MDAASLSDRRRFPRYPGDHYPMTIGRDSARLVDWSAMGIGVQIREGIAGYRIGDRVTISILSEQTHGVALFPGCVRRVDPVGEILGIEFLEDAEEAVQFLVGLLTWLPEDEDSLAR